MAESKHTPGPWEHVAATEHHGHYICSPWGTTVCDLYCMSDPSLASTRNGGASRPIPFIAEDAEANARLIAAAPDLLEALKYLVTHCKGLDRFEGNPINQAIADARAAIAKAEGR